MDHTAIRFVRWSWIAGILLLEPARAWAQAPEEPPVTTPACNRRGWLHRKFHHTAHTIQDKMIGYPENFVEPPLGHYINEQFTVQVAKADPHRFTLYRTDFLPGTSQFSPIGASRFNIMATRMAGWPGPITIEWTPEAARTGTVATTGDREHPETVEPADRGGSRRDRSLALSGCHGCRGGAQLWKHDHSQPDVSTRIRPAADRVGLDGSPLT